MFPFEGEIILENERTILRPVSGDDVDNLMDAALSDPLLLQFSPHPVSSPVLLNTYILDALNYRSNHSRYTFTIYDKAMNKYAGSTSFLNISDENDRLEIGATWYGKDFQRTGLNRNCKYLLLEFAFEQLQANRIELRTDERNIASRQAIERLGASYEGTLRQHTLMYDRFRRNTVCYSLLKQEWPELKASFPIMGHK